MKNKRLVIILIVTAIIIFAAGYFINVGGVRLSAGIPQYGSNTGIPSGALSFGDIFGWTTYWTPEHKFTLKYGYSTTIGALTCPGFMSWRSKYYVEGYRRDAEKRAYDFNRGIGTSKEECESLASRLTTTEAESAAGQIDIPCPWPAEYPVQPSCPSGCEVDNVRSSCTAYCEPEGRKYRLIVEPYESFECVETADMPS